MTFFEIFWSMALVVSLVVGGSLAIAYIHDMRDKIDNINDWIEEQKKKNGEMEE